MCGLRPDADWGRGKARAAPLRRRLAPGLCAQVRRRSSAGVRSAAPTLLLAHTRGVKMQTLTIDPGFLSHRSQTRSDETSRASTFTHTSAPSPAVLKIAAAAAADREDVMAEECGPCASCDLLHKTRAKICYPNTHSPSEREQREAQERPCD